MRGVAYRKRAAHRTAKNCQLDFFEPDDGYFEYAAIVTNKAVTGRTPTTSSHFQAPPLIHIAMLFFIVFP